MRGTCGKQYDVGARAWHIARPGSLPQNSFASIAVYGVAKTLCRHKSDATLRRRVLKHAQTHVLIAEATPSGEDLFKIPSGLDGLHIQN